MHIDELDYHLPPELIAQHPSEERDQSRLMVVDPATQSISHHRFNEIGSFLNPGDCLVLNDTKVRACRLYLERQSTGGRVELFLLNDLGFGAFEALTKAGGKLSDGEVLVSGTSNLEVVLQSRGEGGVWNIVASLDGKSADFDQLEAFGKMPLPPYIKRSASEDDFADEDRQRYQTVYAEHAGAVAAPTAGLHFTPELLANLNSQGVDSQRVTLHVGVGTFRPVSVENVEEHPMHAESYSLSEGVATSLNHARAAGGRIVAVGSTSSRTLESCADESGKIVAGSGETDLMILPPYEFRGLDLMLTNFHLPKSTLMALVMAKGGVDLMRKAYQIAVEERYRFFSYGDSMLIL